MISNPLQHDLEHVLLHTRNLWEELRGNRVFLSGGTGFVGCWLLESFAWANDALDLRASAVVLTRDPAAFKRKAPHLASCPAIRLHAGDVGSFAFPADEFRIVIHAAAEVHKETSVDAVEAGTRRMLAFARQCSAAKFLFTSSGAVYGNHSAPDYAASKRLAESLCILAATHYPMECKIARCFAFAGPYLPIDGQYAFGSFLRDAMLGQTIRVNGDGTPYRSYLYAADLAIWLWTILFRGESGKPYNVGSERAISIAELASEIVRTLNPGLNVEIACAPVPGQPEQRYVPSTELTRVELGLREHIDLREAILRTARWHGQTVPLGSA